MEPASHPVCTVQIHIIHPFFELLCENKAVLQKQPKTTRAWVTTGPQESSQQHPQPARMGLLALESK